MTLNTLCWFGSKSDSWVNVLLTSPCLLLAIAQIAAAEVKLLMFSLPILGIIFADSAFHVTYLYEVK